MTRISWRQIFLLLFKYSDLGFDDAEKVFSSKNLVLLVLILSIHEKKKREDDSPIPAGKGGRILLWIA